MIMAAALARLVVAVGLTCLAGARAIDEDRCAEDGSTNLVQMGSALQLKRQRQQRGDAPTYWYPSRGVNANRSGWSAAIGPFPLPAPEWKFEVDGLNFHQTPVIDDQLNVYTGSDQGLIFSFTKHGQKRWSVQAGTKSCQNPSLYDGKLYTACADGQVLALDMQSGEVLWSKKLCDSLPSDTYTISATENYLVLPFQSNEDSPTGGSPGVALLERADGKVRWTYDITKYGAFTINMAPCLLEDSVISSDTSGGLFRLDIKDGHEIWRVPGQDNGTFTLGGVACGYGMVFNGFSTADSKGGLQANSISDGAQMWTKAFDFPIHNAPAVGQIHGYPEKAAVVVGVGNPAGMPLPIPADIRGVVVAVDANSSDVMWKFEPPPWKHSGSAGSTFKQVCLPDLFSAATVDALGTVYINWSAGGITYALRDANQDGTLSLDDPTEVSAYDLGSGATGPPALAPGFLFVNTCRRPTAFVVPVQGP